MGLGKTGLFGVVGLLMAKKKKDKAKDRLPVGPKAVAGTPPVKTISTGPMPSRPQDMIPSATPTVAATRPTTFRSGFRERARAINEELEGRRRRRRTDDMR